MPWIVMYNMVFFPPPDHCVLLTRICSYIAQSQSGDELEQVLFTLFDFIMENMAASAEWILMTRLKLRIYSKYELISGLVLLDFSFNLIFDMYTKLSFANWRLNDVLLH